MGQIIYESENSKMKTKVKVTIGSPQALSNLLYYYIPSLS